MTSSGIGSTSQAEFALMARTLAHATRAAGLVVPAFRSPPRTEADRTLRRFPHGIVIAVRRNRDPETVARDLIDGIVAANDIVDADEADQVRTLLWAAIFPDAAEAA